MQFQYHIIGGIFLFSVCAAMGADTTPQSNQDTQRISKEISEIKEKLKLTEQKVNATETRIKALELSLAEAMNNIASGLDISNFGISPNEVSHPEIFRGKMAVLQTQLKAKFAILQSQIANIQRPHP